MVKRVRTEETIAALRALANESRLAIFRMLVERGPEGLAAGEIAERLGVVPSSLTFHTQTLMRAGLVRQARVSRQLIYTADFRAMNALVGFLTDNCCQGASNGECATDCAPVAKPSQRRKSA
jgi:ArsR family transcriptional regulator, arsenate/arsenite/antimonite-responsive transcriptional repressor